VLLTVEQKAAFASMMSGPEAAIVDVAADAFSPTLVLMVARTRNEALLAVPVPASSTVKLTDMLRASMVATARACGAGGKLMKLFSTVVVGDQPLQPM